MGGCNSTVVPFVASALDGQDTIAMDCFTKMKLKQVELNHFYSMYRSIDCDERGYITDIEFRNHFRADDSPFNKYLFIDYEHTGKITFFHFVIIVSIYLYCIVLVVVMIHVHYCVYMCALALEISCYKSTRYGAFCLLHYRPYGQPFAIKPKGFHGVDSRSKSS